MVSTLEFHNRRLVIADSAMEKTVNLALRAAKNRAPVLLVGETGTGKELIARLIHERGPMASGPFVSVNCAAIPEGLIEAEFFGYEKGAFTGAVARRMGKFEMADGGTLLLDEISEMPFTLQAKLLRVLQEGEVDRLGGRSGIPVRCRVIATTNRDPLQLILENRFREDLYYRLNVIRIECAPLRGRAQAIEALARAHLERVCHEQGLPQHTLAPGAMAKLVRYPWPGNIRELNNAIEKAALLADDIEIREVALDDSPVHSGSEPERKEDLGALEQRQILKVLQETGGNRTQAAERLGITSRTLRNKLKAYSQAG